MKCGISIAALVLALGFGPAATAQEIACGDFAVLGRIGRQTWKALPKPVEPDVIQLAALWTLDVEVNRVLEGKTPTRRLRIRSIHHPYLNDDKPWAFVVKKAEDGGLDAVEMAFDPSPERLAEIVGHTRPTCLK